MNHIAQYQNRKSALQSGSRKGKEKGKTKHHSRNGIRHQRNSLNDIFQRPGHLASGCHQSTSICSQRSKHCGKKSGVKRIQIHVQKFRISKHIFYILQSKSQFIRPLLYKRHYKNNEENHQNPQTDKTAQTCANDISAPVFPDFNVGNLVVAHIIFLQVMKKGNADNRRNEHYHCNHCAVMKIGYTSQHPVIKYAGQHLKFPSYSRRNTKIRKA